MSTFKLVALRFDQVIKRNSEGRPIEVIKHRTGSIVSGLDKVEAERLLKAGAIVPVDDDVEDDDARIAAEREAANAEREAAARAEAAREVAEREAARLQAEQAKQQGADQGQAPTRPKAAATKPLWEAYATSLGIDIAGLDKDEIIAAVDALGTQS